MAGTVVQGHTRTNFHDDQRASSPARRRSEDGSIRELVERAVLRTQEYYVRDQNLDGYWWYRLESNDTITSEYIMLLRFLEIDRKQHIRLMANHILGNQRSDGTWAIYHGGPGDISTTVEAYFALKLAGISSSEPEMRRAREFILDSGGAYNTRIFTRIFLALFGCLSWRCIPSLPVEINLLPPNQIVSVYDFSSWARATLIPISVLLCRKPVKRIPGVGGVPEIVGPNGTRNVNTADWIEKAFCVMDDVLKAWEKVPFGVLRRRALHAAEQWILRHQEPTGDWGGIQPPMVNSLLALHTLGYSLDHPVMRKGLEALDRFCIQDPTSIELQACVSPVWDTALTSMALLRSGLSPDHPTVRSAARWLLDRQVLKGGDWQVRVPGTRPAGWAFEFYNDRYPDVDDSAVVLMVLKSALQDTDPAVRSRLQAGVEWVLSMRSDDGGWGAFDKNNNKTYLLKIPFADLEALIDPSTADLSGRVLEMMGSFGYGKDDAVIRSTVSFIQKTQEPDGPWWGRWGVNYIYGTWSVLSGLARIGEDMESPYVRKAVAWLKDRQNPDGGWGETCESYKRSELRGRGKSTPSQTAWAILGLMAAGEGRSSAVTEGVRFLLRNQTADGTWEEEEFTGTGFPKYFMIRYHNYRNCFPLLALGTYLRILKGEPF